MIYHAYETRTCKKRQLLVFVLHMMKLSDGSFEALNCLLTALMQTATEQQKEMCLLQSSSY
jgi:hypothetical protein